MQQMHRPLSGVVMLVEDQIDNALATRDMLYDLGAAEVVIAATVKQAKELSAEQALELALLDVKLGQETSEPLAAALLAQGTPFVFATGYGHAAFDPMLFGNIPILVKPYDLDGLRRVIGELRRSSGAQV